MPPLAIPAELKKISPYVRRAEELDKDTTPESRLVAFYCRQYAVHAGIPLSGTSQEAKACLGALLGNLETEKPAMDNFTRDEAAFLCRKFANRVFDKANGEDRMGLANKNTAKTFYAASTFLQILDQFAEEGAEESEEREEDRKRIVYAKWKSTEILKAIKEGRTPTPGGYGEDADGEDGEAGGDEGGAGDKEGEEEETEKKEDAPTSPAVVETVEESDDEGEEQPFPHVPPPAVPPPAEESAEDGGDDDEPEEQGTEIDLGPPPAYPGAGMNGGDNADDDDTGALPKVTYSPPPPPVPAPAPRPVPSPPPKQQQKSSGGIFGFGKKKAGKATKAQLADAAELTRFALAALEDKEADLAADRLRQALDALGR